MWRQVGKKGGGDNNMNAPHLPTILLNKPSSLGWFDQVRVTETEWIPPRSLPYSSVIQHWDYDVLT